MTGARIVDSGGPARRRAMRIVNLHVGTLKTIHSRTSYRVKGAVLARNLCLRGLRRAAVALLTSVGLVPRSEIFQSPDSHTTVKM